MYVLIILNDTHVPEYVYGAGSDRVSAANKFKEIASIFFGHSAVNDMTVNDIVGLDGWGNKDRTLYLKRVTE